MAVVTVVDDDGRDVLAPGRGGPSRDQGSWRWQGARSGPPIRPGPGVEQLVEPGLERRLDSGLHVLLPLRGEDPGERAQGDDDLDAPPVEVVDDALAASSSAWAKQPAADHDPRFRRPRRPDQLSPFAHRGRLAGIAGTMSRDRPGRADGVARPAGEPDALAPHGLASGPQRGLQRGGPGLEDRRAGRSCRPATALGPAGLRHSLRPMVIGSRRPRPGGAPRRAEPAPSCPSARRRPSRGVAT